jgi:hypothetical protein
VSDDFSYCFSPRTGGGTFFSDFACFGLPVAFDDLPPMSVYSFHDGNSGDDVASLHNQNEIPFER